jgi:PTH1 family peptidyl-tRNA hydrolase
MNTILIVGLGNPEDRFARTPHNVGFDVIDILENSYKPLIQANLSNVLVRTVTTQDLTIVLAKPLTYMNGSGLAVKALMEKYSVVDPTNIIVIHDELDFNPGQVRIKLGGGIAGHNGLRSIVEHIGTPEFIRVRIGVGKPPAGTSGLDYVLAVPDKATLIILNEAIKVAADATEFICSRGISYATQQINSL